MNLTTINPATDKRNVPPWKSQYLDAIIWVYKWCQLLSSNWEDWVLPSREERSKRF
jgi:hypothetical protein